MMATRSETTSQRAQLLKGGQLHAYHWVVVGLSVGLTVVATYFTSRQVARQAETRFDRETTQIVQLLSERMKTYEDSLWGGVSMLASHGGQVDVETWRRFAHKLQIEKKYPGNRGVGFVFRINRTGLASYLDGQRRLRPDFDIHPKREDSVFYPITYIEPVEKNRRAVGLDLAHEANRRRALEQARDTGRARVTGPIVLVQDEDSTPGFLFYTPHYLGPTETESDRRASFVGVVYSPVVMKELMAGTLSREVRHVAFSIHDGDSLLYDEHVEDGDRDPDPLLKRRIQVPMHGRTWTFDMRTTMTFRAMASSSQPATILVGGIFVDGLLLMFFLSLARANKRAVVYAEQLTGELNRKAATLERSNRDLEQVSYLASHDLKTPLRGIVALTSFVEEDAGDTLAPQAAEHLSKIRQLVDQVTGLLDELLTYAELVNSEKQHEIVECSIGGLVEEICELNGFSRRQVTVADQAGDRRVSAFVLRSVVNNLICNAFKYGRASDGELPVCEVGAALEGDTLVVSVRDHGVGIPPGKEEAIFEMFRQLQPRVGGEGAGIGLAVVRRLVTNAGGEVSLEACDGAGANFVVRWPI